MSRSMIYAVNSQSQTVVATGTQLNFGNTERRFGCNCILSNGNIAIDGSGYYSGIANITFDATGTGTVVVQWLKNGTAINGASQSFSVVADDIVSLSVPMECRLKCNCEDAVLSISVSGAAGSVTNTGVIVKR